MDPECSKSCTEFIEKRKREIFGVGSCDHQVPYRPVIWQQVPRFIPTLLKKGLSPEQAKSKCLELCENTNLNEECKQDCILDYNAIDNQKIDNQKIDNPKIDNPKIDNPKMENYIYGNYKIKKNKKDNYNYLSIILLTIIIVIIILISIKKLFL
jgi:hypothetical protein